MCSQKQIDSRVDRQAFDQPTFFFPLLEFAAAMAFASFDFCSFGAYKQQGTQCETC